MDRHCVAVCVASVSLCVVVVVATMSPYLAVLAATVSSCVAVCVATVSFCVAVWAATAPPCVLDAEINRLAADCLLLGKPPPVVSLYEPRLALEGFTYPFLPLSLFYETPLLYKVK